MLDQSRLMAKKSRCTAITHLIKTDRKPFGDIVQTIKCFVRYGRRRIIGNQQVSNRLISEGVFHF